jgi:hypothetical protein
VELNGESLGSKEDEEKYKGGEEDQGGSSSWKEISCSYMLLLYLLTSFNVCDTLEGGSCVWISF